MMRPSKRLIPILATVGVLLNVDAAFGCTVKGKVYRTAMRSDLRDLVSAQAGFLSRHGRYASTLDELGLRMSTGVAAITIEADGRRGYSARASHSQMTETCDVYVGARPSSFDADHLEGESRCTGEGRHWTEIDRRGGQAALVFLVALTIATFAFLRTAKGIGWSGRGLAAFTVLFALVVLINSACGTGFDIAVLAVFVLPSVALFALAVRRHVRVPAATS